MTANEIIERAKAEIGTKEFPANSNSVKYNQWFYGRNVSGNLYPWCCAFISWLFRDTDLVKKTASCVNMLEWFEMHGQTVKNPKPGDIVFFKYSTNARKTNHIGLVIGVNAKSIVTIEGNTSKTSNDNGGSVLQRIRSSNIVAFGRPKYSDSVAKKSVEEIAREVISGKWGSGNDRRQKLEKAGYNFREVQNYVNFLLANKGK